MLQLILVLIVMATLTTYVTPAEDEIVQAEKEWAASVVSGDFTALDGMLVEQLIYAHSTGVIEDKSEYMGRLRGGAQKYDRIEHESVTVRTYGDAAVAHSKVRMSGTSDARAFDNRLIMMHVWVRQDGKWRLAAHQTTLMP